MKFLIDNAPSPKLATALRNAGHDAIHVIDLGLAAAEDAAILAHAATDHRILISADADFSA